MSEPKHVKLSGKSLAALRRAKTLATAKYGIGGTLKKTYVPKPIKLRLERR